ncbi:helix-turn-helix transcriptional regulator [Halonotius sp. F2-221B]|uniref:winged helix-turn-helix transcriptional regulator n=1 Tax=Halonotius sp. F2-221B TaxID=2731620 RepID=UPI00398BB292
MVSDAVRDLIGRKRTIEILELLISSESLHYSEIENSVDTSSDMITDTLDLLCKHELVERIEENPRRVKYKPTETGRDFIQAVEKIEEILEVQIDS